MTDQESEALILEVHRLRELVSLMAEHGEQTVVHVTIWTGKEWRGVLVTASDEAKETKLVEMVGAAVEKILAASSASPRKPRKGK